jgi:hypothetical protein
VFSVFIRKYTLSPAAPLALLSVSSCRQLITLADTYLYRSRFTCQGCSMGRLSTTIRLREVSQPFCNTYDPRISQLNTFHKLKTAPHFCGAAFPKNHGVIFRFCSRRTKWVLITQTFLIFFLILPYLLSD